MNDDSQNQLDKQEAAEDQVYHGKITGQQRATPLTIPEIPSVPKIPSIPEIPKIGAPTAPKRDQTPESDDTPEVSEPKPSIARYNPGSDHSESPIKNPQSSAR